MIGQFAKLSLTIPCRFGCGKKFNGKPAESRHALRHCKKNPGELVRRVCPFCNQKRTNMWRHVRICPLKNRSLNKNKNADAVQGLL